MRALPVSILMLAAVACAHGPTTQVTPREATPVNASFERTWNAVIDVFAERNIPIATIDKTSGLIATRSLLISAAEDTVRTWIDCGDAWGVYKVAYAEYNVLVRGDSVRSTVKISAAWNFQQSMGMFGEHKGNCVTKHVWERAAEADIRARAERPH